MKKAILWFRQDLRLHDNEALAEASQSADIVYPVYVFNEYTFLGKTKFGFPKTNKYRTQFILESVRDLRNSLQSIGSDLLIRFGRPERVLFDLAKELKTSWIFCNRERTHEEVVVQDALEKKLWSIGQEMRFSRGKMLYYTQDLPFPITHTPNQFAIFRKEVEKFTPIRQPLPIDHKALHQIESHIEKGIIPYMRNLGWDGEITTRFKGGETAGLSRLKQYFWDTNHIDQYQITRDQLLGDHYSSKFSPYLAQGCLSPKMIYAELKRYELEKGANDSTHWMFIELMWRDFFRLMGKKHGNKIFRRGGFQEKQLPYTKDNDLFWKWADGETGIPFIDANMRELNQTGFMSNRGRQNVSSFLVNELNLDWLKGASYFESMLIDYDPCSNYGNWNYLAGVGADTRPNRHFNILGQAKKYDPDGAYVKKWIPALSSLDTTSIHDPDSWTDTELIKAGIHLGKDYPKPIFTMDNFY